MKFDLSSQLQEPLVQTFHGLLARCCPLPGNPVLPSLSQLVEGQVELYWVGARLHDRLQASLR